MKNLKLLLGIITLTMISIQTYSQEYKLDEKEVTGIFEIEGKNKSELFSAINKWVSINYNSAKNVIQMNDPESGTIIIKGINEVVYKNILKSLYPKNKYISEYSTNKFNHLIEINIKDDKYRVIYKITDLTDNDGGIKAEMILKCISLNGLNDKYIDEYKVFRDSEMKNAMVGKKKREKILSITKAIFEELNSSLLNDIKLTMKSIEESIKSKKNDSW